MGFTDLAIVSPTDPKVLHRHKVIQRASGAKDILQNTKVYDSLKEAVQREGHDRNIICGTGMPFDMYQKRKPREYIEPRVFFDDLVQSNQVPSNLDDIANDKPRSPIRLALVFGCEDTGMTEEDMDVCHTMLGIPTNPQFGSLNLASAVQLIAYDWRMALGGHESYEDFLSGDTI